MFRKTIAASVASLMALSLGAFSASSAAADKYKEAIGALGALEIMVGDAGSGDFRADDPIKRSEFAKVAIHALGLSDIAASLQNRSVFPDVAEDHWAKGYIAAAAEQGIFIGDTAGNFRPDDSISYEEAVTVLVRMAGYEPSAKSHGGYPAGYLTIGQTEGVLDRIPATPGEPCDRKTVAQMTYNALNMKMMVQTGAGNNQNYEVVDETLLEDRLHAKEVRGILEASSHIALSGTGAGEGRIQIGGTVYNVAADNADALVGQTVRALIRETDNGEEAFFLISDSIRTKTLTLAAEDVVSLTSTEIVYDNGAKHVTEKLSAPVTFLVNGRKAENAQIPAEGTVSLIANSSDTYSVVSITSYETMLAENVYASAHKITGTKGETLTLDPEDKNLHFTLQSADGAALSLSDLQKNDVLSVAKSADGQVVQILVSRKTAEGTIDEISGELVTVSGKTYTLSSAFSGTLKPGEQVTLRLDANGKIAAADRLASTGAQYAYLISTDMEKGLDGKLLISVLSADGKVQTLTAVDRIRLDGQTMAAADAKASLSDFRGLVTLEENDAGLVTDVTRAADETASFPQSHDNRFVLNTVLTDAVYNSTSMKMGSVSIDENTVFFNIPDGITDSAKYTVDNYTILTDKTEYNAYVYDMKEDMTAGVVLLTNATSSIAADAPLLVVDHVARTQNSNEQTADKLYGLSDGKSVTLLAAEGVSLSHLAAGDVVQYRTDSAGLIAEVRPLLTAANRETEGKTALSETVETVYGKVVGRFASSVNVSCGAENAENYKTTDAAVYLYDSTRSTNAVQTASLADIAKYEEDGSRIFLRLENGMAKEIVIVK